MRDVMYTLAILLLGMILGMVAGGAIVAAVFTSSCYG